jgi:hypothetical protein
MITTIVFDEDVKFGYPSVESMILKSCNKLPIKTVEVWESKYDPIFKQVGMTKSEWFNPGPAIDVENQNNVCGR